MKKVLLKTIGILGVIVLVYCVTITLQPNVFPNYNKKHAMLRLEDVALGDSYTTVDDLGKLRAVFDYLHAENVPFSVAVIPHSIYINKDGTRFEKGIDSKDPDDVEKKFIALLQEVEKQGNSLGMHGYTHQYGTSWNSSNRQNTGIGYEFNIKEAPATATPQFAAERITDSLAAFQQAGLTPDFWESPHYGDTREQEKVFQSYIGILYQPDMYSLTSLLDMNMYDHINSYQKKTEGSVYIPAPLRFVKGAEAEKSVQGILSKLPTYNGLDSMFYHPFLEFPFLEVKRDNSGNIVEKDGLPVYEYKKDAQSHLHKLVTGFKEDGFQWMSLHEIVPFSPANAVELPKEVRATDVHVGDVTGKGFGDIVIQEATNVSVISSHYGWPRNQKQGEPTKWLSYPFTHNESILLGDMNGDNRKDLLIYNHETGELKGFFSDGNSFHHTPDIDKIVPPHLSFITDKAVNGKDELFFQGQDQMWTIVGKDNTLITAKLQIQLEKGFSPSVGDLNGDGIPDIVTYSAQAQAIKLYQGVGNDQFKYKSTYSMSIHTNTTLLLGDTNGDKKEDIVLYDSSKGTWQVFQSEGNFQFVKMDNEYGPWGRGSTLQMLFDFDGNGKVDIGSIQNHTLNMSLSFQPVREE